MSIQSTAEEFGLVKRSSTAAARWGQRTLAAGRNPRAIVKGMKGTVRDEHAGMLQRVRAEAQPPSSIPSLASMQGTNRNLSRFNNQWAGDLADNSRKGLAGPTGHLPG